jgi:hypothetical protein
MTLNHDQAQVLRDALLEFVDQRSPVEDYVAQRYASHPESFRERKRVSVTRRIEVARDLLNQFGL